MFKVYRLGIRVSGWAINKDFVVMGKTRDITSEAVWEKSKGFIEENLKRKEQCVVCIPSPGNIGFGTAVISTTSLEDQMLAAYAIIKNHPQQELIILDHPAEELV